MAVRIPQYDQRTAPNTLGPQPRARGVQVDDSMARAGMRLAGALDTTAGVLQQVEEKKRRDEEEDAKVWTAATLARAQAAQQAKYVEMQDTAGDGAPEFARKFNDQFSQYEESVLAEAPNEPSKKFLRDGMTRLRVAMTAEAFGYETTERRKWRVQTGKEAIDATAASMAADPRRLAVSLAEQRAMIDSYDIPAEQKRALRDYLDEQVSTAAVLGEVERDPLQARQKLSARLGIDEAQAAGPVASADVVWRRMIQRESGGQQAARSPKGAVGIAQIMPETGPEAARYANLPWDPERFANDANYNAALGRAYYDQQLRTYQSPALAAAAYNAGPGAVNEWIERFGDPRTGEVSVAEFAAKIPFKETREYVAAVAAPGSPTIAQAGTDVAPGANTGDLAYDLLPVPKVVQLLGQTNSALDKQQAQFRSFVATREADDLAAFGDGKQPPQPLTVGEFVGAYGDVEGMQRWSRYQSANQYASELAGLATKTPAEIQATLIARQPAAGPGYATTAPMYAQLARAAQATLQARQADPIAFAQSSGLTDQPPLDLSTPETFAEGLSGRVGVAQTMNQKYGTPYTLLTRAEGAQLSATMGGMTAPEKAAFLQKIRGALPSSRAYQSVMTALRPDSPVTAIAGSIMVQQRQVQVAPTGWFSRGKAMPADQVALRIIEGEDLLNPAASDKNSDGKPKLPLPPEGDLRAQWVAVVGDAYRGSAQTEADSYQAFRAFYAAEVARKGKYDGELDGEAARLAAHAVTGGVADVNGAMTVLPWGMPEDDFLTLARQQWGGIATANGLSDPFDSVTLQAVAAGRYAAMQGTDVLRGRDGQPLVLTINPNTQPAAVNPTPEVAAMPSAAAVPVVLPGIGIVGGGR